MSPLQDKSSDAAAVYDSDYKQDDQQPRSLHLPLSPRKSRRSPIPPSEKTRARDDLWIGAKKPLSPLLAITGPRCPLLTKAEKPKNKRSPCPRRKIFSGIVNNNCNASTHLSSPTQSPRKVIDFHRFDPSATFLHDTGDHYKPIAKLPSSYAFLPTVPTPLKRLYLEDGSAACLLGTYPLQRLPSILRQSSYRKLPLVCNDEKDGELAETETFLKSLNLTESVRVHPQKNITCECNDEDTAPSSTSQSSCEASRVLFDPRITVIEFKNDFQRQWISEAELERYKRETISLAENYLKSHPELIEKYSTPFKDSVTCTFRRKALYSLPVMSQCGCDDQDGNDGGDHQPSL